MESNLSPAEALKEAVRIAGSQSALARTLGVSQHAVWNWLDKGLSLPGEHVLQVEAATGVSRHDLRPDLYPRDESAPDESGHDPADAADRRAPHDGEAG